MSGDRQPDEPLVGALCALLDGVDPVPPAVTEAARAALGWRRLDADLAELLSDTVVDERPPALVRGEGTEVRSVSFAAGTTTIDMEIHVDGDGRTLLGQLAPPVAVTIEVQRAAGSLLAVADSDSLGRFRVELPAGGTIRLRIAASVAAPAVETSWIPI